ncbi:V-type proton ATPase subunit E [Methanobrevibacter sp. OttesenSCG-928-K11]|nr:V-type proton ATPase subunit E [Methanobrevibacter sp. OttesenSCG-928-K11]MDL2270656.1 V-type proton ATPase subunit E [Methanobrevibacter sp. OttesenSCG-928-I08]
MSSGTDKIVSSIMSEAQVKADEKIQTAQTEVNSVLSNGEKKAEAEKNKILDSGKKQSDMRYQQIISEAKMNARRAELEAKEEVIEASFNKAYDDLKQIASTNDEEYVLALKNMVKEAAVEVGSGNLIVQVKEGDIDKIKSHLGTIASDVSSDTTLEIGESINTIGGAIVKTENGDIEVNNTIESRLSRFKKSLRNDVANILFKS